MWSADTRQKQTVRLYRPSKALKAFGVFVDLRTGWVGTNANLIICRSARGGEESTMRDRFADVKRPRVDDPYVDVQHGCA